MIKTIEIRFITQPLPGDTFAFTVVSDGEILTSTVGIKGVSMYYTDGGDNAPHGIEIGEDLNKTVAHTRSRLQIFNSHPSVNYDHSGNSIFVAISYSDTLLVQDKAGTPGRILIITEGKIKMLSDFDPERLRMAYNNDVIRFGKSVPHHTALYSDINIGGVLVRLYPDPKGNFYFNFKPYAMALINTRDFEDTLVPGIEGGNAATFVYDFANGTVLSCEVSISMMTEEDGIVESTYPLCWLAGAEQLDDNRIFLKTRSYVLSPGQKHDRNRWYLKYWEGYPFDIPFYLHSKKLKLTNNSNGLAEEFTFDSLAARLVVSDGRTNTSIEDLLPLMSGYNDLHLDFDGEDGRDSYISLEKIPSACGVYFKWLNRYGGYSYWLFENTYSVDRSSRSMGELDRDNENLEDTFARTSQIGRESRDTIRVVAELLTQDEVRLLEGILDSPKIYMFTGRPFSRNSYRDWIEVALKTGNARIKNPKQPQTNFTFDLELPERYTQTL